MLKYNLEENILTENANNFFARPVEVIIHTENDMAEALAARNLVSKSAYLAQHEAETEILEEWVAKGEGYTSKTVQIHLSIPGTYKPGEYPKEAAVKASPGKRLRIAAQKTRLMKTDPHEHLYVEYVEDTATGSLNSEIMSGAPFKIIGHNLKIAGTDPSIGIDFLSLEDPEAVYRVDPRSISVNNPSELVFIAPWMVTGEPVAVRITTQYAHGRKLLNKPRSCTFDRTLTVIENVLGNRR